MRRLVKEQLLKFDGTPLFPERIAYTVNLRPLRRRGRPLQASHRLRPRGVQPGRGPGKRGPEGHRRLRPDHPAAPPGSSPEAIYQSLKRRRERLEKRLREEQLLEARRGSPDRPERRPAGAEPRTTSTTSTTPPTPRSKRPRRQFVDQASAARTIAELRAEIELLTDLEKLAPPRPPIRHRPQMGRALRLLQNNSEMFDAHGHRRKLVIFTEHRDTLNYLAERIRALIGRPEAVVTIHGGIGREERRKAQEAFTHDKEVEILVATDAAGEGINLQRAHLMVNYDLPWNPNRLEQRFGRIHRIGQTEVCHLWNLVAKDTREGEVYHRLLEKLDEERKALGGQVFDVLGQLTFEDRPLRELLLEADPLRRPARSQGPPVPGRGSGARPRAPPASWSKAGR